MGSAIKLNRDAAMFLGYLLYGLLSQTGERASQKPAVFSNCGANSHYLCLVLCVYKDVTFTTCFIFGNIFLFQQIL
jgi:hypothetical protein